MNETGYPEGRMLALPGLKVGNVQATTGGKPMHKRIFATALAGCFGACLVSMAASAQQATDHPNAARATTGTKAKPAAVATADKQRAVPSPGSGMCLRYTGSHIRPPRGQCLPVPGVVISQQDIQRTGANNLGQALRMLSPSVQVNGGGH